MESPAIVKPQRLYSLDALCGFDRFWIMGLGELIEKYSKTNQPSRLICILKKRILIVISVFMYCNVVLAIPKSHQQGLKIIVSTFNDTIKRKALLTEILKLLLPDNTKNN